MAKHGIVYVIHNILHPSDLFKVGLTTNSVEERIKELNSETSNPGKFKVCAYFPVSDVYEAEKVCHQRLDELGLRSNKEFFSGEISRILTEVERVCLRFAPKSYLSPDYIDGTIGTKSSEQSKPKAKMRCGFCDGKGKVRIEEGFFTIERTCSDCSGNGHIWI
ncbi:GIY-YIG nuclease family protein [Alphaproteobacteria bacterium]|nr:GIY-YIG nuclease family protein [Alphaproteobacteria bacterium]